MASFQDNLLRQLGDVRRLTQPFEDLRRLTEPLDATRDVMRSLEENSRLSEQVRQPTQPSEAYRLVTESLDKTNDVMRSFEENSRFSAEIERLTQPSEELRQITESLNATRDPFMGNFVGQDRYLQVATASIAEQLRVTDLESTAQSISDFLGSQQVNLVDRQLSEIPNSLDRYVDSLSDIRHHLSSSYNQSVLDSFSKDIQQSILPTLIALREEALKPATGLMTADQFTRQGVLSWEWPNGKDVEFGSAVWLTNPPSLQSSPSSSSRLKVLCEVRCSICGDPMIKENVELSWDSSYELFVSIDVAPICSACTRRANESPEYWDEHLDHLFQKRKPRLRLIQGKGNGSAKPKRRDHLYLIKSDHDDDE